MAAVRELVRRPAQNLRILSVPQGGFQVDMLIGAGCVAELEAAAVTLGEHGLAPRFTSAIKSGSLRMKDFHLPRHSRRPAGRRKGRAVHAAARHRRLGPHARAAGLADDR